MLLEKACVRSGFGGVWLCKTWVLRLPPPSSDRGLAQLARELSSGVWTHGHYQTCLKPVCDFCEELGLRWPQRVLRGTLRTVFNMRGSLMARAVLVAMLFSDLDTTCLTGLICLELRSLKKQNKKSKKVKSPKKQWLHSPCFQVCNDFKVCCGCGHWCATSPRCQARVKSRFTSSIYYSALFGAAGMLLSWIVDALTWGYPHIPILSIYVSQS